MFNLKEFRSKAFAYPDLLPWGFLVENGIVITKSGGLLAGWEYIGPDLDSAMPSELIAMSLRVNEALRLGDGWVIHCDAIREPAPGYALEGAFPDATTALMDDVRRQFWEKTSVGYRSRYVLIVTWFPEPDAAGKVANLFMEGVNNDLASRNLQRFKERLNDIEGRLSSFLKLNRLLDYPIADWSADAQQAQGFDVHGGREFGSPLLGHLDQCAMPGKSFVPMVFNECPMFLDSVIGNHDLVTGFSPNIDDRAIACLAMSEFPAHSYPGLFDFLSRMSIEYRWSNRFICLDKIKADKVIGRDRSRWSNKRLSLFNHFRASQGSAPTHLNLDAVAMTEDAVLALAENSSGEVMFGYYTSVLLLTDERPDYLDNTAREVAKFIRNQGVGVRIETVNAVEALLGTMPGNTESNIRRPLVHTLNLAHLLPFTAVWAGPDKHPCPMYPENSPPLFFAKTDGATPFRFCLHANDVGHGMVVGVTGSGKSTLLGLIAAQQFRYPGAQVFAFDVDYSMLPLVWAAGGQHYDIAGDARDDLAFCPLGQIDAPAEQAWAAEWIEALVRLQGITVAPGHRKRIHDAVLNLAQSTTLPEQRTLTHYRTVLQDDSLREALERYTLMGPGGNLLDAQSDSLKENRFQVFELRHLMDKGEQFTLPTLLYLFHRIEQRLRSGRPTLLILDEIWLMLKNPVFAEKISDWLVTLRKRNAAVVFATQSLVQLQQSSIAPIIYQSCPTKILLADVDAPTQNIRPLYEAIGLNAKQIQIIAQGTPKRDYYMIHPSGKRQFELGLSPTELAFIGVSGSENLNRIRVLKDECGDSWPAQWLFEKGLPESAQKWESIRQTFLS
jgi:type IV secretion system protein VirB4